MQLWSSFRVRFEFESEEMEFDEDVESRMGDCWLAVEEAFEEMEEEELREGGDICGSIMLDEGVSVVKWPPTVVIICVLLKLLVDFFDEKLNFHFFYSNKNL